MAKGTVKKAFLTNDNRPRMWTGVPLGVVVGEISGNVMPDMSSYITNEYAFKLMFQLPGLVLGSLLMVWKKTRRMAAGVLIGAAADYAYSFRSLITAQQMLDTTTKGAPVQILGASRQTPMIPASRAGARTVPAVRTALPQYSGGYIHTYAEGYQTGFMCAVSYRREHASCLSPDCSYWGQDYCRGYNKGHADGMQALL